MKSLQLAGVTLIAFSSLASCTAQSLGEAARQQQEQKKASSSKAKHVITNDDLGAGAKATDTSAKPATKKPAAHPGAPDANADEDRPSAEEIQANIKDQKQKIRDMESQVKEIQEELEPWKTSDCTHVLHANTSMNACDVPQRLTADLERAKSQLEAEKKNLTSMQEDARKMGFANSVYDPN